jgi:hypothetical protein
VEASATASQLETAPGGRRERAPEYSRLGPKWARLYRRHDRSGLTVAERNAVILFFHGAREAAAKALGWTPQKSTRGLGRCDEFIETEVARILHKFNQRRIQMHEDPDRLDEREAEPAPPPGAEKLDERVEEVPPPPSRPPERAEEKDDDAA